MLLTSMRRARMFCAGAQSDPVSDTLSNNRLLASWLSSVSQMVENYLNRDIHIQAYTEYFDVLYGKIEYFLPAIPVITLTDVYHDNTGLWTGGESECSNPYIGKDNRSIVLRYTLPWMCKKGLRVRYTGGLAYHAVNSEFILTTGSGTFTVGNYVKGSTSGAIGVVVSYTLATKTLVVENYYGVFQAGETINTYTDEEGLTSAVATDVIASISKQSLAEAYPAIVTATELQLRYMWRHTTDFENAGTNKDGTTLRRGSETGALPLQPEAINLLGEYRRLVF